MKAQALGDFLAESSNTTPEVTTLSSSWNLFVDAPPLKMGVGPT